MNSIKINTGRFELGPQLVAILENTARGCNVMQRLEEVVGLHQHVEVHYHVTHYVARIVDDCERHLCEGRGKTILQALEDLERSIPADVLIPQDWRCP